MTSLDYERGCVSGPLCPTGRASLCPLASPSRATEMGSSHRLRVREPLRLLGWAEMEVRAGHAGGAQGLPATGEHGGSGWGPGSPAGHEQPCPVPTNSPTLRTILLGNGRLFLPVVICGGTSSALVMQNGSVLPRPAPGTASSVDNLAKGIREPEEGEPCPWKNRTKHRQSLFSPCLNTLEFAETCLYGCVRGGGDTPLTAPGFPAPHRRDLRRRGVG